MICKVLGCTCLLLGCTAVGLLEGGRRRRALHLTEDILLGLEVLERELALNNRPLPDMLRRAASGREYTQVKHAFICCAQESEKGNDFTEIWKQELQRMSVGSGESELLQGLCGVLGRYDGQGQEKALSRVRDELDRRLVKVRQEVQDKCRVYTVLGGAVGGVLSIVLV